MAVAGGDGDGFAFCSEIAQISLKAIATCFLARSILSLIPFNRSDMIHVVWRTEYRVDSQFMYLVNQNYEIVTQYLTACDSAVRNPLYETGNNGTSFQMFRRLRRSNWPAAHPSETSVRLETCTQPASWGAHPPRFSEGGHPARSHGLLLAQPQNADVETNLEAKSYVVEYRGIPPLRRKRARDGAPGSNIE